MTRIVPDARRQLQRLWKAAFGEPPCIEADPAMLAEVLVRCLPPVGPYEFRAPSEAGTTKAAKARRNKAPA